MKLEYVSLSWMGHGTSLLPQHLKNSLTLPQSPRLLSGDSLAWDQIRGEKGIVIFHFLGSFDPIWGLFFSEWKCKPCCILLSFQVFCYSYFPPVRSNRSLKWHAISYRYQIHSLPTLQFSYYWTEAFPDTQRPLAVELPSASHGYLVLIYFTVSFADIIRYTITSWLLLFIVFLCYHISVIFPIPPPEKMTGSVSLPTVSVAYLLHNFFIAM